ncbi:MAG: hypothetical protein EA398_15995 [Deltaproteobacteria bacterium]|nr:MAG: hypothetical protein EA398_15995 [Deltaproteobacteria bacterium]
MATRSPASEDALPQTISVEVVDRSTLRGEAEVDEDLLRDAVSDINAIYAAKGLEMARALGNYVVETFFGGDLDRFHDRGRGHATFRALAGREDLQVAYTTIWYAVAVLDQLRQLPEDIAGALPLSHHKLLLPVRDAALKVELAERAVAERLSSRALAEVIRDARPRTSGPRVGRPPLPAFVKGLTRLRRAVEVATAEPVDEAALQALPEEERAAMRAEFDAHIEALQALRARLG